MPLLPDAYLTQKRRHDVCGDYEHNLTAQRESQQHSQTFCCYLFCVLKTTSDHTRASSIGAKTPQDTSPATRECLHIHDSQCRQRYRGTPAQPFSTPPTTIHPPHHPRAPLAKKAYRTLGCIRESSARD